MYETFTGKYRKTRISRRLCKYRQGRFCSGVSEEKRQGVGKVLFYNQWVAPEYQSRKAAAPTLSGKSGYENYGHKQLDKASSLNRMQWCGAEENVPLEVHHVKTQRFKWQRKQWEIAVGGMSSRQWHSVSNNVTNAVRCRKLG